MNNLLKGNYSLSKSSKATAKRKGKPAPETTIHEFERRAMERLGGSIAFVIKQDNFVWNGATPKKTGGKKTNKKGR